MRLFLYTVIGLAFLCAAGQAVAQNEAGRVPVPETFTLEKIGLNVVIDGQLAACTVKYVLYNPGKSDMEVDFLAPLPEGGTITGVTLLNGSQEMAGQVYGKDEALEVYRAIVARLRDPALLEYAGRDTYRARVFPLPAGGRQTLELKFDYLIPKERGEISFIFPMAGPMTIGQNPEQEVHALIRNRETAGAIYSPVEGVKIDESGADAVAAFSAKSGKTLDRFSLYYQNSKENAAVEALVLSHKPEKDEDGFFLLLAEPALKAGDGPELAKNVVFVLDQSGSMDGPKFKQARAALTFVLERLNERDNFNLVNYDTRVYSWQPEMMRMTPENRKAALAYVENLRSGGNTNIAEALNTAFPMFGDPTAPNYLLFLTDGLPTVGEQNEARLAAMAKNINPQGNVRLFAFGVGFDVNARLLDRLSGQAGGASVFVNPDENLETAVSAYFSRLSAPTLTRLALASSLPINRVIPTPLPDLFLGHQLVVTGRYPRGGETSFTLKGNKGDKEESFRYTVNLAEQGRPNGAFIAQVWAQRRIGELIDEIDLAGGTPSQELVDELVELSKTYGILTPYTSFLALEDQALAAPDVVPMASRNLSRLKYTVGADANRQRSMKSEMKAAIAPKADNLMPAAAAEMDMEVARRFADKDSVNKLTPPKQLASQTFYFKNGQWQGSDVSEADIKKAKRIKQESEEYFALAKELAPEEMVWLSQAEPIIFKHKGKSYLIEPA